MTAGAERQGQEVEPVTPFEVTEERCGLPRNESECRDLASPQLFERHILGIVDRHDRELDKIEKALCGNCRTAVTQIDVNFLVGQVGDALDLRPCQ